MAQRQLDMEPPGKDFRFVGYRCIYHEQQGRSCHNPLDCDLVPMWSLTIEAALAQFHVQSRRANPQKSVELLQKAGWTPHYGLQCWWRHGVNVEEAIEHEVLLEEESWILWPQTKKSSNSG